MNTKHDGSRPAARRDHGRAFLHGQAFLEEARRRTGRSDSADAFVPEPDNGPVEIPDEVAEEIAESFLESVTSGAEIGEELADRLAPDEAGGPFVETDARQEIADDIDESNPEDAEVEPFPTVHRST